MRISSLIMETSDPVSRKALTLVFSTTTGINAVGKPNGDDVPSEGEIVGAIWDGLEVSGRPVSLTNGSFPDFVRIPGTRVER